MKIKPGTNFVVFLLFFGVAMLDAFRGKDWEIAGFWLLIGIVFLLGDFTAGARGSNNN